MLGPGTTISVHFSNGMPSPAKRTLWCLLVGISLSCVVLFIQLTNFIPKDVSIQSNLPANAPTTPVDVCFDKAPLVDILKLASMEYNCSILPSWSEVTEIYGREPVIIGLDEHCPSRYPPRVAGLYHTGTNALSQLLNPLDHDDTYLEKSYFRNDVPWGKHVPWSHRNVTRVPPHNTLGQPLSLVLIRDPYQWMQSMCQTAYGAKWKHDEHRCPNLVDIAGEPVPVTLKYSFGQQSSKPVHFQVEYLSLIHAWNAFYSQYLDSTSPRLLMRTEDWWFFGPQVWHELGACLSTKISYRPQGATSKVHGGQNSLQQVMIKYGSDTGRRQRNMARDDLQFAARHLNRTLMSLFRYRVIEA